MDWPGIEPGLPRLTTWSMALSISSGRSSIGGSPFFECLRFTPGNIILPLAYIRSSINAPWCVRQLRADIAFSSAMHGATAPSGLWPPSKDASIPSGPSLTFSTGRGCQFHAQPPTWKTRVSPFVWVITFDLPNMRDLTSNYANAGIALRILWPRKPHHAVKVERDAIRRVTLVYPQYFNLGPSPLASTLLVKE